jgi:hypothetical protein
LRRARCIIWAIAMLALGAGCAHTKSSSSDASTSKSTAAGSPPPAKIPPAGACAPATRTRCITAADEGATIDVRVGETFTLELRAPRRSFSEPTQSGAKALELIGASRSGAAAEAYYRALAPGRVLLRSVERPLCRRRVACPQYLVLWQVQVLVG